VNALIDAGLDVLTISRRIGHSSAGFTLRVYGHLFSKKDTAAAAAIEAALSGGTNRCQFDFCSSRLRLSDRPTLTVGKCHRYKHFRHTPCTSSLFGGGVAEWLKAAVC
jgi:hypothetical protein